MYIYILCIYIYIRYTHIIYIHILIYIYQYTYYHYYYYLLFVYIYTYNYIHTYVWGEEDVTKTSGDFKALIMDLWWWCTLFVLIWCFLSYWASLNFFGVACAKSPNVPQETRRRWCRSTSRCSVPTRVAPHIWGGGQILQRDATVSSI